MVSYGWKEQQRAKLVGDAAKGGDRQRGQSNMGRRTEGARGEGYIRKGGNNNYKQGAKATDVLTFRRLRTVNENLNSDFWDKKNEHGGCNESVQKKEREGEDGHGMGKVLSWRKTRR